MAIRSRYLVPVVFITALLLMMCKDKDHSGTDSDSASMRAERPDESLAIAGDWISGAYLERLQSTGSPRLAQEPSEECYIRIPASPSKTTSMIYSFHEAGPEVSPAMENGAYLLREKPSDDVGPSEWKIVRVSPDSMTIGGTLFVRFSPATEKDIPLVLEELLFKGHYTTSTGQPVEFRKNGEVIGLDEYRYYVPVIDYFDAGLQIDQVGLGPSKQDLTYFGFKFQKNRLELYEIKCLTFEPAENRCVEVDYGKKVTTLTRVMD